FMSGGVDSTALTYLSAQTLGRPVSTITLLPPNPADRARALSYIRPVRSDLTLHEVVEFDFDPARRLALAHESPDTVFQVEPAINSLSLLIARLTRSASTMLAGMFAEEVTGSVRLLAYWLASTGAWTILRRWRNVPVGRRASALWFAHRIRR